MSYLTLTQNLDQFLGGRPENLKKAEAMFQHMGMDYWLAKAQEALARL